MVMDMTRRNPDDFREADLARRHLAEGGFAAPDVRLGRILATREALRCNRYDSDHVLDVTVSRLQEEIGSYRRESSNESNSIRSL